MSPFKREYWKLHRIHEIPCGNICDVFGVLLGFEHRTGSFDRNGRSQDEFRLKLTDNLEKPYGNVTIFSETGIISPKFFQIGNLFRICGIPVKKFRFKDEFYLSGRVKQGVSLMILSIDNDKLKILYQSHPGLVLSHLDGRVINGYLVKISKMVKSSAQDFFARSVFDDIAYDSKTDQQPKSQPMLEISTQTQYVPATPVDILQQKPAKKTGNSNVGQDEQNGNRICGEKSAMPTFQFANTMETPKKQAADKGTTPSVRPCGSFVDKLIGKSNPLAIAMAARRNEILSQENQNSQNRQTIHDFGNDHLQTAIPTGTLMEEICQTVEEREDSFYNSDFGEFASQSVGIQTNHSTPEKLFSRKRKFSTEEVSIQAATFLNIKTIAIQTDEVFDEEQSQFMKDIAIQVGVPVKTKNVATQTDRNLFKLKAKKVMASSQTSTFNEDVAPAKLNNLSQESLGRMFSQFLNVFIASTQKKQRKLS